MRSNGPDAWATDRLGERGRSGYEGEIVVQDDSLRGWALAIYVSYLLGAFTAGGMAVLGVIGAYVKRGDARGTWLDSHYGWQIRTFWWAVLWVVLAVLLIFTVIGIPFAWLLAVIVGLWVLYRILRGWTSLANRRPIAIS